MIIALLLLASTVACKASDLQGGALADFLKSTVATGEVNYCSEIEEDSNYQGNDIRYENRTNHWFPATISTCCASCRNSKSDPGAPAACVCWVWGYNNNKDCHKGNFNEDEGCCWLKQADSSGRACDKAGRSESASQMSGHFVEGEPHEGGIPDRSSGWGVVAIIMGFVFVGTASARVSPSFGRNLKSLVVDGVTFTTSIALGRRGDYAPIKRDVRSEAKINGQAEAIITKDPPAGRSVVPSVTGEATALHAAAAIGKMRTTATQFIFVKRRHETGAMAV